MKLSFTFTLFFATVLAFGAARSFLDGEVPVGMVDDASMEFNREADEMAAVAAEFKHVTLPEHSKRVKHLKANLLPMFKSLPKNRHGKLVPQVARYALHRLFEQQHSWSVNGVRPARAAKDENIFGQLPASVASQGISINNLALLAAVLEVRIHKENEAQLKTTYTQMGLNINGETSPTQLDVLVDRYMSIYISGMREYNLSNVELEDQKKYMQKATSDWQATNEWVHNAQHDAMRAKKPCGHGITDCSFDFQSTSYVVEEVVNGYGSFNHGECTRLKHTLLKLEDRKTGRVSLADFYKEGMSGTWEFNEKVDYLRDLGTLDESMPGKPRVIVANYVNSYVNCLTSSSLYSVCCRSECEDLLGHLEQHIESHVASPERILQLVRNFQSPDFGATTSISELSYSRLHKIAKKHRGTVPLHGRLFAQWLHHVFPRNCPFPHAAGATNPLTPDEWMKEKGHTEIKASHAEIVRAMKDFAVDGKGGLHSQKEVADDADEAGEHSVPWSDVEDVVTIHHSQEEAHHVAPFLCLDAIVMFAQVFVSMGLIYAVLRVARVLRPKAFKGKQASYEKVVI